MLLDKLIQKTVEIALDLGLIKSKQIIVDSHTCSMFNYKSPIQILEEKSKQLCKSIYKPDESYKNKMTEKPQTNDIQEHLDYCNRLVNLKRSDERLLIREDIRLKTNLCPNGHMSIRVAFHGKKKHKIEGTPLRETYFFDVEKCKRCPLK